MTDPLSQLRARFGAERVGEGGDVRQKYALGGQTPLAVMWPTEPQMAADMLQWAAEQGLAVVPWGGGTQQAALPAPTRYDLALVTARLNRVLEYEPAELVITVEAGMTVAELARTLQPARQFLPVSVPDPDRATVGGLIATNAAGPERLRYGAMRDLILGVTVALPDGSLVRGGGKVVKNVAGYDLTRLFNGSWGTLGVITAASLRLYPLPEQRQTLIAHCDSWSVAQAAALKLYSSPLRPEGLSVAPANGANHGHAGLELLVRFGGLPVTLARQIAEARELIARAGAEPGAVLEGEAEAERWAHLIEVIYRAPGVHLQASVLPSQVAQAVEVLQARAETNGWPMQAWAHVGAGTVLAAWEAPTGAALASAITEARTRIRELGGWLTVRRAEPQDPPLDHWGETTTGALPLMRQVKQMLDPGNTLNPGRFLV